MKKRFVAFMCATAVVVSVPSVDINKDGGVSVTDKKTVADEENGVLEYDSKGREVLAKEGDVYVSTKYLKDSSVEKTYYVDDENKFQEKVTTKKAEADSLGSFLDVKTEYENGDISINKFDYDGNISYEKDNDEPATAYVYDNGRMTKRIIGYKGDNSDIYRTEEFKYDDAGNKTEYSIAAGIKDNGKIAKYIERYGYDEQGNMISCEKSINEVNENARYSRSEYKYDDNSDLVKTTDYDEDGNVVSIAQFMYDENHNVIKKCAGNTTEIDLKNADASENSITTYVYDGDALVKEISADGNEITYDYYDDGLTKSMVDKDGTKHEYTYRQGVYRESEKVFFAGNNSDEPDEVINYIQDYDDEGNAGMLTKVDAAGVVTEFKYDEGKTVEEVDGNGNIIHNTYNDNGYISSLKIEDSQGNDIGSVNYVYDDDKLALIQDNNKNIIVSYSYDENGNVLSEKMANGACVEYLYNEFGKLAEEKITDADGTTLEDIKYEYTVNGNICKESDGINDNTKYYRYDCENRLVSEKDTSGNEKEYQYDAAGNCISVGDGDVICEREFDELNRITKNDDEQIAYDTNGNLVKHDDKKFEFDSFDRLIKAEVDGDKIEYSYDGNNRLIKRVVNGEEEQLIWANDMIVAKVKDGKFYYNDLSGTTVASSQDGNMEFYIHGKRGDTIAVLDQDANVQDQNNYSSYGVAEFSQKDEETFEKGFSDSFYDEKTGLVYLNARFYSPELGVFMSEDSIEGYATEIMTLNRYAYCLGNPINYTDKTGHWGNNEQGKNEHVIFVENALKANGYNNDTMKKCMTYAEKWADRYFNYYSGNYKDKLDDIVLGDYAKNRMNLQNVKNGILDVKNVNRFYDDFVYQSPYHGRGYYYEYIAYLLSLSLQFEKGYQINQIALKSNDDLFKQINFEMLICLSSLYEDPKTGKGGRIGRVEYGYLILGICTHLSEDIWAHTAIVTDKDAIVKNENVLKLFKKYPENKKENKAFNEENIKKLENAIDSGNYSYCELKEFATSSDNKVQLEKMVVEGNTSSGNKRRGYAQTASNKIVKYFKSGCLMYSGQQTVDTDYLKNYYLGRPDDAKDEEGAKSIKCSKGGLIHKNKYICKSCQEGKTDSCYGVFHSCDAVKNIKNNVLTPEIGFAKLSKLK